MTNALRALRRFEGNELRIYQQMLLSRMKEPLIMQAQRELEPLDDDDDECWDDDELNETDLESFLYVRGERKGRAQALLELLRVRGLEVDANSEAKILACRDTDQLIAWLTRAVTASCVAELFEPQ